MDLLNQGFEIIENSSSTHEQYLYWAEMFIFTYTTQLAQQHKTDLAIKVALRYLEMTPLMHSIEFPYKKTAILKTYLSLMIQKLDQPPPLRGIPKFEVNISASRISSTNEAIMKQIRTWLPLFENLVTTILPFPTGENQTHIHDKRHQNVLQAFDWWVQVENFNGMLVADSAGDIIERHYKLLEVLQINVDSLSRKITHISFTFHLKVHLPYFSLNIVDKWR